MQFDALKTLIVLLACIGVASSALADDITLRSAARLPSGATQVTLADIADLTGEYANSLSNVVIVELSGPPRIIELSVAEVRERLDEANAHWGKVNLQGGRVVIRPRMAIAGSTVSAMQPVALHGTPQEHRTRGDQHNYQLVSEFAEENTVRGAIGRYIAAGLATPVHAIKLAFEERDEAILDVTASTYRIEVEAVSSLKSDRVQMVVRLWDHLRVAQNVTLTVLPLVRSDAVIAARSLGEGAKLLPSDVMTEEVWASPSRNGWFTNVNDVTDKVLDRSIRQGERVLTRHLRKHIIIKRGDRAIVRCLVGGIVLSLEAECRQEGAEGEMVEFRKLGERDTFFATVTAPGEAVMDLSNRN